MKDRYWILFFALLVAVNLFFLHSQPNEEEKRALLYAQEEVKAGMRLKAERYNWTNKWVQALSERDNKPEKYEAFKKLADQRAKVLIRLDEVGTPVSPAPATELLDEDILPKEDALLRQKVKHLLKQLYSVYKESEGQRDEELQSLIRESENIKTASVIEEVFVQEHIALSDSVWPEFTLKNQSERLALKTFGQKDGGYFIANSFDEGDSVYAACMEKPVYLDIGFAIDAIFENGRKERLQSDDKGSYWVVPNGLNKAQKIVFSRGEDSKYPLRVIGTLAYVYPKPQSDEN